MRNLKNKTIGVLCGGTSEERKISLRTGDAVFRALKALKLRAVKIDVRRNIARVLETARIDIAFIALHGPGGEDGSIQGMLEMEGIPYTGSGILASALSMDKIYTKQIFRYHRLPTADFETIEHGRRGKIKTALRYPVVVKPSNQGSTIGVTIAANGKELAKAVRLAVRYGERVLIEEYIRGKEISVGILGNTPLPVIEIVPAKGFYDFRAKYAPGGSKHIIPARIPPGQYRYAQSLALAAHRALGCRGVSRADMIIDGNGKINLLEVNSVPGMTERSLLPESAAVAGIDFRHLVLGILMSAVER